VRTRPAYFWCGEMPRVLDRPAVNSISGDNPGCTKRFRCILLLCSIDIRDVKSLGNTLSVTILLNHARYKVMANASKSKTTSFPVSNLKMPRLRFAIEIAAQLEHCVLHLSLAFPKLEMPTLFQNVSVSAQLAPAKIEVRYYQTGF
jgi:hypothetical protein